MKREAIILVAGMGTRLKPLTLENHKCLTKVNGREIVFNALDILSGYGIAKVTLVVGYLADTIKEAIGDSYKGMSIEYTLNDIYDKTNTSYSLQLGLRNLGEYDELYILEGDVFFSKELFDALVSDTHPDATLLEPYREDLDGTFVALGDDGFVCDWTHKSMREEGYTLSDKYKTINLHKFKRSFVDDVLTPAVDRICEEKSGKDPLENVMREIVRADKKAVFGTLSGGCRWYEIDDLADLKRAEEIFS